MIEQNRLATQQRILSQDDPQVNLRKAPFTTLNITATSIGAAEAFHIVPDDQAVMVERLSACNTTAGAVKLSIYVVPPGGAAGVGNASMVGFDIAANAVVDVGDIIGGFWTPGATIRVHSDTSGAITLSGYYGQIY